MTLSVGNLCHSVISQDSLEYSLYPRFKIRHPVIPYTVMPYSVISHPFIPQTVIPQTVIPHSVYYDTRLWLLADVMFEGKKH